MIREEGSFVAVDLGRFRHPTFYRGRMTAG
jgi:hypothetical protein